MFSNALVRRPCRNLVHGLSAAGMGLPDYGRAVEQHNAYVEALRSCGLAVTVLESDEAYPDSVFIEDTAVCCEKVAVIARPGANSRRGEEKTVALALADFYPQLEGIRAPGTLEGGDVMRAGERFYIGLSAAPARGGTARTNGDGAQQLTAILRRHGYESLSIPLRQVLHLKTGISYLDNNRLLACGEFLHHPLLSSFAIIPVPAGESYAANSLWVNGRVLVPAGFPGTRQAIEKAGYDTVPLDVSEFRKLDGGLSCLSLRF